MSSGKIVVIDDNMNDVQLIRRVLERAGYEVIYANSGEEGLRIASEVYPDCLLVDYRMPGLNGYEVSRRVKDDAALRNVPVLMLTGADSARNLVEGLDAGADDYVTKSADLDVILARVRALLRVKAYQDRIVEQAEQLRRLYEEVKDKSDRIMALNQRLNKDLQFARRVQESLLPARSFSANGLEIRSAYIPSETLSGDFYDYFLAGDRLFVFMGDVSGHGLPAAILVSILKSFLHSEAEQNDSVAGFMASLNDFFFTASLPNQYATGQFFRIDAAGDARFSSAAHPPFLLVRSGTEPAQIVERPGHLLGAMPGVGYDEDRLELRKGDTIFLYTDGLTDRRTPEGDFYTLESVSGMLEQMRERPIDEVYHRLFDEVSTFPATDEFRDDIAFILARKE